MVHACFYPGLPSMCLVLFDVRALWSWPAESIGVFLGLEVEPLQHLGLFSPVKGCQMSIPPQPPTPPSHDTAFCVLYVKGYPGHRVFSIYQKTWKKTRKAAFPQKVDKAVCFKRRWPENRLVIEAGFNSLQSLPPIRYHQLLWSYQVILIIPK